MPVNKKHYVRKPLFVEAVQVTHEDFADIAAWCQGRITASDGSRVHSIDPGKQYISVRVHNPTSPRQSKAYVGDWIVYTDRGYKVYTNKAFSNVFVEDGATENQAGSPKERKPRKQRSHPRPKPDVHQGDGREIYPDPSSVQTASPVRPSQAAGVLVKNETKVAPPQVVAPDANKAEPAITVTIDQALPSVSEAELEKERQARADGRRAEA